MPRTSKYTQLIEQHINLNIGESLTPQQIAAAVNCTLPTVYSYIKSNPNRFTKVSAGQYRIESNSFTA